MHHALAVVAESRFFHCETSCSKMCQLTENIYGIHDIDYIDASGKVSVTF